jgi:hypothetical protein
MDVLLTVVAVLARVAGLAAFAMFVVWLGGQL